MGKKENSNEKLIGYPPNTPEQRLVWEFFFLLVIIIAVGVFGQLANTDVLYTIILTVIFSVNISIRFILVNEKGDWIFFVFGVIAGGGNDLMSMVNGVYSYNSDAIIPFLDGLMPLWMVVFWGQVFLMFRKIFHLKLFKGEDYQKTRPGFSGWIDKQIIVDLVLLVCLRIVIYNTYWDPLLPGIIYGSVILLRFAIFHPKKNELLIIAILPYAFIFEGLMVIFGFYIYINPVLLGQPVWLFLWWIFLVPIVLKQFFDRFECYLKNKT